MRTCYKYLTAWIAGSVLVACVDKSPLENGQDTWQQGDTPYYVNLRLKTQSDTFTRAGDDNRLTDGEHFEHDIDKNAGNFAMFFDEENKYISYADLYSVNEEPNDTEKADEDGKTHGHEDIPVPVEATYSCRFYGFANRKPAKVLVVVNAPEKIYRITDFPGWTLDDVMQQVWEEKDPNKEAFGFYVENGKKYFTMTNTTYVDRAMHCAESIPDKSITTDESRIQDLEPVTIYLERMVSKFSMSLSMNPQTYKPVASQALQVRKYDRETDTFTYFEYPWAIQLLGWGLNGLETQNYLFKNVDPQGDWLGHNGWNSKDNRRCFWSVDPHYYKDETGKVVYPWQYDFAKDKYNTDYETWYEHFHSYDEDKQVFALKYYSFKEFCSDVKDDGTMPGDDFEHTVDYWNYNSIFYTPENTFVPGMQVDRSRGTRAYELAGSHVLLCARLLIDPEGGTDYAPYSGNIYRNRVGVCYIDDLSLFEDFMSAVNYKLAAQKYMYYKYYPWSDDAINEGKKKTGDATSWFGQTIRAITGQSYVLFYHNKEDEKYYKLTAEVLAGLGKQPKKYRFVRPADAVNADGKIIPWIMYNSKWEDGKDEDFKPLNLYILSESPGDKDELETYEEVQKRKLKFQSLKEGKWYPEYDQDEPVEEYPRDDNDIQSLFYEIWGVADCFRHGLMYYAVPIYAQDSNGKPASGDTKELQDTSAGFDDPKFYYYYGVIRNNWYDFTLHSIMNPGIPVMDVNKPIVPNYLDEKDQVKVEMEILGMHVEDITVPID